MIHFLTNTFAGIRFGAVLFLALLGVCSVAQAQQDRSLQAWTQPQPALRLKVHPFIQQGLRRAATPTCNAPLVSYFQGPVVSNVQVISVFWTDTVNSTTRANINQFYDDVSNSVYIDALGEYSTAGLLGGSSQEIGRGGAAGAYVIAPQKCAPGGNNCKLTDQDVQNELTRQIDMGVIPAPQLDSAGHPYIVYSVYFPPNISLTGPGGAGGSCTFGGFCAYHSTSTFGASNVPMPYAALMDVFTGPCALGCGGNATALQDQTSLASHELAETITDPEIGLVTGFTYAFPAGWGDNNNNCGEIADICDDGSPGSTITVAGRAWVVQPFWSNRMRACVSSEPARPSSTISWANPSPITYGTPLSSVQLNASAGVTGTFVYSPVAGAVLPAGPQTLSVQFTPDDPANYTLSSATATLQVNQATPVITWPTPPPIALGTPLTGAQLNASANVPGTFVYIPPSGTVPPLGVQTLGVQFSPSDTTNYRSTSASVTLQVNLPPSSLTGVSVTASGLAYSRVSQMFIGTVTVRNISATTIAGPLEILFATLPSGVTLVNATGALGGLPYLTWPGAGLAPGQSATVSVQFRNPGNVQINCTPVIYSGSF